MSMRPLSEWNRRQMQVFERYCRVRGVPLTLELLFQLAQRYARKHAVGRDAVEAGATGTTTRARPRTNFRPFYAPASAAALFPGDVVVTTGPAPHPYPMLMALPEEPSPPLRRFAFPPHSPAGAPVAPAAPAVPHCFPREGRPGSTTSEPRAPGAGAPGPLAREAPR